MCRGGPIKASSGVSAAVLDGYRVVVNEVLAVVAAGRLMQPRGRRRTVVHLRAQLLHRALYTLGRD